MINAQKNEKLCSQCHFRLGDETQDTLINRPVITLRVQDVAVDDGKWHKFSLFQVG